MHFPEILGKIGGTLLAVVSGLFACTALSTSKWVQRHVFYAHKFPIWWGQKLEQPESFGFLSRQVIPFRIPTADGESLFAWLVAPLRLYAEHEWEFIEESKSKSPGVLESTSFRLLESDPNSRLIIYFHGNAGSVAQTRRTDAYRLITSGASDPIYVLTFDYRGFGKSTGSPSEEALINDTVSVIDWAIKVANVSPERIVLVAQSLGTAIAAAAASRLLSRDPKVEIAGLVLCAAFCDAPSVLLSYSIGGVLPILAPLRLFNFTKAWFARRISDQWRTSDCIQELVRGSTRLRITLLRAINDEVVRPQESDKLFKIALDALQLPPSQNLNDITEFNDLGEGGCSATCRNGNKEIRKVLVRYGGHNGIMKWLPVALEVCRMFQV